MSREPLSRVDAWTSVALLVGFTTLYTLTIDLHATNVLWHNFVFDADIDRVTGDATTHQSAVVFGRHPLFILALAGPATVLSWLGPTLMASLRLVVACVGALGVVGARLVFHRMLGERFAACVFAVLYGLTATTWLLSSIPETFAFNATAIVGCFLVDPTFAQPRERPGRFVAFALLSALAIGVTVSNAAYVALACFHVARHKGSWRKGIASSAASCAAVAIAFVGLSLLQKGMVGAEIAGDTGVVSPLAAARGDRFLDFGRAVSVHDALSVARAFMVDNVAAPGSVVDVVGTMDGPAQMIQYGSWREPTYLVAVAALAALLLTSVGTLGRRGWQALVRSDLARLAVACLLLNLGLHYFYRANGQPFIFTIHTVLPVLVLLGAAYAGSTWSPKRWLAIAATASVVLDNAAFVATVRSALVLPCARKLYLVCPSWAGQRVDPRMTRGLAAYLGSADYLSDEGSDAIDHGDARLAERYFQDALARSPDLLSAQRGLGLSLVMQGDTAHGADILRRVLERQPDDDAVRDLLGQLAPPR